jgi:hypothetical protein
MAPNLLRDPTQDRYLWIITSRATCCESVVTPCGNSALAADFSAVSSETGRHHLAIRLGLSALRTAASALHYLTVWCGYWDPRY